MRWAAPEFLLLLWIVPLALAAMAWTARARRRDEEALGDPEALRTRSQVAPARHRRLRAALLLLATTTSAIALARPQAGLRLVSTTSVGPDVVLALDLSTSMRARDVRPDRLATARREIAAALRGLDGSAIGLVGFAGEARVLSPLTTDLEGLRDRIDAASPEAIEVPGSNVGGGLALAARLLDRPGDRGRAVILVTDGEQLDGDPGAALPAVRASRARLAVMGIGTPQGGTIPVVDSTGAIRGAKRDPEGREIVTKLDEDALRALARQGGGRYERGDGSGSAGGRAAVYARGDDRGDSSGRSLRAYDERFHWLAGFAALLLAGEAAVPRRRTS